MNLLQLLLSTMTTSSSVNSVSEKSGISEQLTKKLIIAAIPLLIKYMTKNASSTSGAQSLASALLQHNSNRTISEQLSDADQEDGDKIIGHILGDDKAVVIKELSKETGATSEQVTKGLASLAPALLSGLFTATSASAKPQANTSSAGDLSSLLSVLGGSQQQAASSTDLLSALFGGTQTQQQTAPSSGLMSLFGLSQAQQQQTQQAADPVSSLLGSLFGTSQQTAQTQTSSAIPLTGSSSSQASSIDGTALLNILSQFMK